MFASGKKSLEFDSLDWQNSVISIADNTSTPPTEVNGNRYLLDAAGGGVHADWDGAAVNDIVEFNGSVWVIAYDASADEGGACWVEDEDTNYVWDSSTWISFGSTVSHNNTTGLQGGTTDEFYHRTLAEENGVIPSGKTISFAEEVDNGDSGATDTIDWTVGNKQKSTLTANCVYTFSPEPAGPCNLILKLVQGGAGSYTVTWPADVKWPGGTAPTLSTGVGEIDFISFYYDGTDFYGQLAANFS